MKMALAGCAKDSPRPNSSDSGFSVEAASAF
jgi:hypothetical protein